MTATQAPIPSLAHESPPRRARASDPDTSHDAAAALTAERIRHSQAEVLGILTDHGAMCDTVIAMRARQRGSRQSSSGLRTRRAELVKLGKVRDSGRRVALPSGKRSIVWEAIPADDRSTDDATTDA